jgi:N-acetylglucosaminyldiphosphoundecaprenol N-acetyl-beta-D-mannosaminyltransferase
MTIKSIKILGVKVSLISREAILPEIEALAADNRKHLITTPNPEFLLESRKDEEFLQILNRASLALPDGIGLKIAGWFKGVNLERCAGADLTRQLLALAEKREWPVAVINWHAGLSNKEAISQALKKHYPELKSLVKDERRGDYIFDISDLKHFQPKIIFSTLGAPYQEKLLARLLSRTTAAIAIGVGGSFDYLTGKAPRAPKLFRTIGLEWLWRLLLSPRKRLRRIYRAVAIFPLVFFREEVFSRIFYRPNVVGWLFKDGEVLLVNAKNGDNLDHWKLPQGGVEADESKQEALMREMAEELGTVNFEIIGQFANIYKYKWPREYRLGYKGQRQTLFILKYNGRKHDIKLSHENKGFKWVPINDLINEAEIIRRPSYALFLEKYREVTK